MIKKQDSFISILFTTGTGSEKIAAESIKSDADDYITKKDILKYRSNSFKEIISSIINNRKNRKLVDLHRELLRNSSSIGVIYPVPMFDSPLPFSASISPEQFYLQLGVHFMSSVGSGHGYPRGLFRLPVPKFNDYYSYVYAFRIKDNDCSETRLNGENYFFNRKQ